VTYDPESYVHRIGRTGRAGRSGEAILFIAPRERNMLRVIERATRQPITQMELPTVEDVNEQRVSRFNQRITTALESGEANAFRALIERYEQAHNVPAVEIAAALASIAQGKTPLFLDAPKRDGAVRSEADNRRTPRDAGSSPPARERFSKDSRSERRPAERVEPAQHARPPRRDRDFESRNEQPAPSRQRSDEALQTYRVEVGEMHGVKPSNIVGAIANEAGLDGKNIGRVVIREDHSFVDLPGDMPKEIFRSLQKVRVGGQQLQISLALRTQAERLRRERGTERRDAGAKRDVRPKRKRP
jgi:ATP-dependent RNA helicase DeaD